MSQTDPQPEPPQVQALLARIRQLEQSANMLRKQNKKLRARIQALRAGVDVEGEVEGEVEPEQ